LEYILKRKRSFELDSVHAISLRLRPPACIHNGVAQSSFETGKPGTATCDMADPPTNQQA
jgi:hypothetical protein